MHEGLGGISCARKQIALCVTYYFMLFQKVMDQIYPQVAGKRFVWIVEGGREVSAFSAHTARIRPMKWRPKPVRFMHGRTRPV